jgi:hypothetical protein
VLEIIFSNEKTKKQKNFWWFSDVKIEQPIDEIQ